MCQLSVILGQRRKLVKHVANRSVVHRQAYALADIANDLPILAGFAGRIQHLVSQLHAAVGVGIRVGVGVGTAVAVATGVAVGTAVGATVGIGVGVGTAVAVGTGVGTITSPIRSRVIW